MGIHLHAPLEGGAEIYPIHPPALQQAVALAELVTVVNCVWLSVLRQPMAAPEASNSGVNIPDPHCAREVCGEVDHFCLGNRATISSGNSDSDPRIAAGADG